jgi:hypothetical protein
MGKAHKAFGCREKVVLATVGAGTSGVSLEQESRRIYYVVPQKGSPEFVSSEQEAELISDLQKMLGDWKIEGNKLARGEDQLDVKVCFVQRGVEPLVAEIQLLDACNTSLDTNDGPTNAKDFVQLLEREAHEKKVNIFLRGLEESSSRQLKGTGFYKVGSEGVGVIFRHKGGIFLTVYANEAQYESKKLSVTALSGGALLKGEGMASYDKPVRDAIHETFWAAVGNTYPVREQLKQEMCWNGYYWTSETKPTLKLAGVDFEERVRDVYFSRTAAVEELKKIGLSAEAPPFLYLRIFAIRMLELEEKVGSREK